jgi:uncharacterized protein with beta-barrel porin domain
MTTGAPPSGVSQSLAYTASQVNLVLTGSGSSAPPPSPTPTPTPTPTPAPTPTFVIAPGDDSLAPGADMAVLRNTEQLTDALLEELAEGRTGAWLEGDDFVARIDSGPNGVARRQTSQGAFGGVDRPLGQGSIGVDAAYVSTQLTEAIGGSAMIDAVRIDAYGRLDNALGVLSASAGVAADRLQTDRIASQTRQAKAAYDALEATASVQESRRLRIGGFDILARAGLTYDQMRTDRFDETGAGGQDISGAAGDLASLRAFAGLTLDRAFRAGLAEPLRLRVNIAYAHEMLAADARATVFAQDGTAFSTGAWNGGRDGAYGGLNLSQGVGGGVSLFADYRLQPRLEGVFSERAIVGLRWVF